MHEVLNRNLYFVKEHIGLFKAANNYDILDPTTGQVILECREPKLGPFTKLFRFTDFKRMTPFDIRIQTPAGEPVVRVRRGATFLRSRVRVFDEHGQALGGFHQKLLSVGGAFTVVAPDDRPLCMLKGKWTSWEFSFTAGGHELAKVTKKWAGLGKELFTSADNYILQISDSVPPNNPIRQLILAAVMCIDMVLKE
jgi:uncharacterized protein YxjI